jgi:DNA-binding CsgD family transcriptional regulator
MLQMLGLDARTELVFRLVVEEPGLRLHEIVTRLGQDEQQVRAALDRLAELCLLDRHDDTDSEHADPAFHAVDPAVGLPYFLSHREAELVKEQRQLEAAREIVSTLAVGGSQERGHKKGRQFEVVRRLEGLDAVRERLVELAELARVECLSVLPAASRAPDVLATGRRLGRQALERGVRVRSIYQDSFRNEPNALRHVDLLGELGAQSRTLPILPIAMAVVDNEVAVVPLDPENSRAGALELRSEGAVAVARSLFESLWTSATPVGPEPPRDANGLTPQEDELLALQAKGHTDATAARLLGISLRTVRRMNAALAARMSARSRFQAGAEAARRGWI